MVPISDNLAITPGSGASLATDDIASVHYQRVKIAAGADGSATDVSAAAPLPVDQIYSGISNGRKVVTTAGTAVTLASSTTCRKVDITAETDNTGVIVVGGSTVVAALATRQGTPLNAGDTLSVFITNLSSVYLDSTVSGDGVTFTYYT